MRAHRARAFRKLRDVVAGVAQGAPLAAAGQGDWIIERAVPAFVRHQSLICFSTTKSSGNSGSLASSIRLLHTGQGPPGAPQPRGLARFFVLDGALHLRGQDLVVFGKLSE
jgi:hypothetical protein